MCKRCTGVNYYFFFLSFSLLIDNPKLGDSFIANLGVDCSYSRELGQGLR